MKVRLIKPIRYGTHTFEIGTIGTVVTVNHPLIFNDKPIYDYYVKFEAHKPIGIFKTEIEESE